MRPRAPRGTPAFAVSIILHVVIGAGLLRVLTMPNALNSLFSNWGQPAPVERIGFLALPRSSGAAQAPKAGGDDQPDQGKPSVESAPVLTAPSSTPVTFPAVPVTPLAPKARGGTGEMIGGGGPTRGVRPSYNDPRLWLPTGPVVSAPMMQPKTLADSLHQTLADKIRMFNDSVALANPEQRAPGDWTYTDKSGKKWGIDQQFIRLGKFSIPTAVLSMLPLNAQANPIALDRQRTMTEMTRQIQEQATRAARDDAFKAAVKALRERKDKERKEAQAKGETPPPALPAPAKP